jgi:tryptophan synthase alpha chain
MSTDRLQKALDKPHKKLITFLTAGDPDYAASLQYLKAMAHHADIIELGMPFSDPMADGDVIQKASIRALDSGMTLKRVLNMVRDFRVHNQHTPIILMGYANPIFKYGIDDFCHDAALAGVDGFLIVDLPPEESGDLERAMQAHHLHLIRLITPVTPINRIQMIAARGSGFLYYVSITGVTGAAIANHAEVAAHIAEIKTHTNLPIMAGFGIKTADDAKKFSQIADGVVVGSVLVQMIAQNTAIEDFSEAVSVLKNALSI